MWGWSCSAKDARWVKLLRGLGGDRAHRADALLSPLCSEVLYEDEGFRSRQFAALVASKVFYHLGAFEESLNYALGAGDLFNVNDNSEYVETIIGKQPLLQKKSSCQNYCNFGILLDLSAFLFFSLYSFKLMLQLVSPSLFLLCFPCFGIL